MKGSQGFYSYLLFVVMIIFLPQMLKYETPLQATEVFTYMYKNFQVAI